MKVLLSWVREFVDVAESAEAIGARLSVRGLALEGLERFDSPASAGSLTASHGDAAMDFDVAANRPDCLSMIGIAREIAAAYGVPMLGMASPRVDAAPVGRDFSPASVAPSAGLKSRPTIDFSPAISVTIDEPDLCARYVAAVAEVTVGPSPAWMQARLLACGIRPISNIVDITNYVLLELGQPMHAFDLSRLAGPAIRVRRARPGETLKTLDGKVRLLTSDTLVIADAHHAQAIGGVMGGFDSEVSDSTRRVVFEAAWFDPASVRATSKRLGLRTEASMRFERGADVTAPMRGMRRACALLEAIGAGAAEGQPVDAFPRPHTPANVKLNRRNISGLLGMDVPDADAVRILHALGFAVERTASHKEAPEARSHTVATDVAPLGDGASDAAAPPMAATSEADEWTVGVPAWRVDVHRPVDLIEEIGRHYGFEHLPATYPSAQGSPGPSDRRIARDRRVRGSLLGMGFSEAITFAFIEQSAAEPFLGGLPPVALANPLSEKFAVMRPSLLPGLVDAVGHNRRHGRRDVRLFEIGTRFSPAGESRSVAMAWTGLATADHWSGTRRDVDFFDMKGVLEQVAALTSVVPDCETIEAPHLMSGRAGRLLIGGTAVGAFGQLAPEVAEGRGLPADAVYVGELDLDALTALAPPATVLAEALPRHPSVVRDISILVHEDLSAETVRGTIRAASPSTLVQVREFDRYQGKGVPAGQVSLSLRLTFRASDRTLTDDEVQADMRGILAAVTRDLKATQR